MKKIMQRDYVRLFGYEDCKTHLKQAYMDLQRRIAEKKITDIDGLKGLRYVIFMSDYNVPIDGSLYKVWGVSVKRPSGRREGDGDPSTLLAATEPDIDEVVANTWPVDEDHDYDQEIDEIFAGTYEETDIGWGWATVDESKAEEYSCMLFTFLLYYERWNNETVKEG